MDNKPFDVHCHLEQKDYDKDRDIFIESLKEKLFGVITCSAHINDLKKSLEIIEKNKNFVYLMAGVHPTYVDKFSDKEVTGFINELIKNKDKLIAIGEIGLDYYWIKDEKLREKQKVWFVRFIELAKKLNKPIVIHSRDAREDTFNILEKHASGMKILLHCYSYSNADEIGRVIKNNWSVSIGPGILKSKSVRKSAKKIPLNLIMLETDSPWFGFGARGTSINVYKVAEKIAEEKRISQEEVIKQTNLNTKKFFCI